jgi:hypothetical protein
MGSPVVSMGYKKVAESAKVIPECADKYIERWVGMYKSIVHNIESWFKVSFFILMGFVTLNLVREFIGFPVTPFAVEGYYVFFATLIYGIIPLYVLRTIKFTLSLIAFHLSYKK